MSAMKILPCDCKHEFQDERFGKGKRVHNECKGTKGAPPKYRCSVCNKEKEG